MLTRDVMQRSTDQNDRPGHCDGEQEPTSTAAGSRAAASNAGPRADQTYATSPTRAASENPERRPANRRVGPFYFNLDDKLGKGVYGEVFRAYMLAESPPPRSSETLRDSYEETAVTPQELSNIADSIYTTVALKRMKNPGPADGWTAASLREISVLKELGNPKPPEERTRFIPQSRAYFLLQGANGMNTSRRPSMRSWSGLTDFQPLTTSTTAGLSQDDDLNSFATNSGAESSTTPAQVKSLELPSAFPSRRRRQLTTAQRSVKAGAQCVIEMFKFMLDEKTATVYIATELCEGGDLHGFLRKQKSAKQRISDPALYKRWMRQIVQGVAFMHDRHISHRDLKPQNVLLKRRPSSEMSSADVASKLDENPGWGYNLKVGDFGLARVEDIPIKKYEHEAITLAYRSPDTLLGNLYLHYASDVWSLGCILLESASGLPMFRGRDDKEQLKHVLSRFGGFDKESFPSVNKYSHSAANQPLLAKIAQYHRDEIAKATYQQRFEEEMVLLRELEPSFSAEFLEYSAKQEPRHVAVIRMHLRDYFSRHPGLDVLGEEGLDMVSRMLMLEPSARLTLEGCLAHPFFATDSLDAELDDDDQFMEVHDLEDHVSHRAPWITKAEGDNLASQSVTTPVANSASRRPILTSRGIVSAPHTGTNTNDTAIANSSKGDNPSLTSPNATSTNNTSGMPAIMQAACGAGQQGTTRTSASYVLPPALAQQQLQQQRLSQSASEIKAYVGSGTAMNGKCIPVVPLPSDANRLPTNSRAETHRSADTASRLDASDNSDLR